MMIASISDCALTSLEALALSGALDAINKCIDQIDEELKKYDD